MLVQVAMIAMAMFGILALVTDMGYVTLTRVQMQNAADAAAIEGLRNRERMSDGNGTGDGYASDCVRRAAVQDLVRWTFDDDFDPSADARNFGAGPVIALTGGDGTGFKAYQTIERPGDPFVYKPVLALNQSGNLAHGDMVSGTFDPAAPSGEDNLYSRADFAPNADPPGPTTTFPSCPPDPSNAAWPTPAESPPIADTAFLVRMRRTNDVDGVDNLPDDSSTGPTLPFLFGRGTAIHQSPDKPYNPRDDGLTVRATSIAVVRPAMRVGLPSGGVFGVSPFALESTFAARLHDNASHVVTVGADGTISEGASTVGRFVASRPTITTVGQTLPAAAPPTACGDNAGYGPVYAAIGATQRIVGFVVLSWSSCDVGSVTLNSTTVARVAAANATAVIAEGLPTTLTSAEVLALLDANKNLGVALLAPALAR